MRNNIEPINRLVNKFAKLPNVGSKTASRYAYSIIGMSESDVQDFCAALLDVKKSVRFCSVCGTFTDKDICDICRTRDKTIICVVSYPKDMISMEKISGFKGVYHVLHGTLNPMDGKGPDDIRIKELLARLSGVTEVIMATNPDVEGEATALYIAKLLKNFGIKVTRIAQGISIGSDIEFADEVTLSRAMESRTEI